MEYEYSRRFRCKNAVNYMAIYKPKCNNGNPCELCKVKYELANTLRIYTGEYINLAGFGFNQIDTLRSKVCAALTDIVVNLDLQRGEDVKDS